MGLPGNVTISKGEGGVILDPGQHPTPSRQSIEEASDVHFILHRQIGSCGPGESGRQPGEENGHHLGGHITGDRP